MDYGYETDLLISFSLIDSEKYVIIVLFRGRKKRAGERRKLEGQKMGKDS